MVSFNVLTENGKNEKNDPVKKGGGGSQPKETAQCIVSGKRDANRARVLKKTRG